MYELADMVIAGQVLLAERARKHLTREEMDLTVSAEDVRRVPPFNHLDAAHLHLIGTGLTQLGSAAHRDNMHAVLACVLDGDRELARRVLRLGVYLAHEFSDRLTGHHNDRDARIRSCARARWAGRS